MKSLLSNLLREGELKNRSPIIGLRCGKFVSGLLWIHFTYKMVNISIIDTFEDAVRYALNLERYLYGTFADDDVLWRIITLIERVMRSMQGKDLADD